MRNTSDIREKMLKIWEGVDSGKITAQEARVHIGIARAVLDTLKVEIAAAHLNVARVPSVDLGVRPAKLVDLRQAAALRKKRAA